MNTNILKKCIEALKENEPDLSYLRGMLDTLLEMQQSDVPKITSDLTLRPNNIFIPPTPTPTSEINEAAMLDSLAKVGMAKLKESGQPLE